MHKLHKSLDTTFAISSMLQQCLENAVIETMTVFSRISSALILIVYAVRRMVSTVEALGGGWFQTTDATASTVAVERSKAHINERTFVRAEVVPTAFCIVSGVKMNRNADLYCSK